MSTELSTAPATALPAQVKQDIEAPYRTAAIPSTPAATALDMPRTEQLQTSKELAEKTSRSDQLVARKASAQIKLNEEEKSCAEIDGQHTKVDREVKTAEERLRTAQERRENTKAERQKIAEQEKLKETQKQEELKKKDEELKVAESEVKAAEFNLKTKRAELEKIAGELSQSKAKIAALKSEIAGYDKEITKLNSEIETLTNKLLEFEQLAQDEKAAKERKIELQEEYELRLAKTNENSHGLVSDQQTKTQAYLNASNEIGFKSPESLKEALRNGSVTPAMINAMITDPGLGTEYRKILEQRSKQETLA